MVIQCSHGDTQRSRASKSPIPLTKYISNNSNAIVHSLALYHASVVNRKIPFIPLDSYCTPFEGTPTKKTLVRGQRRCQEQALNPMDKPSNSELLPMPSKVLRGTANRWPKRLAQQRSPPQQRFWVWGVLLKAWLLLPFGATLVT